MPIFKPKYLLSKAKRALLIGTLGASLLAPREIHHSTINPTRFVAPKTKVEYVIPEERSVAFDLMLNKLHISRSFFNVRSEILKRLQSPFFANYFPQLIEKYIELTFKKYDLDPIYGKAIFFNRKFDLRNPLSLESPYVLKHLGIDRKDIKDPFMALDYTLQYINYLKKKYPKANNSEIFSIYLYGSFKKSNLDRLSVLVDKAKDKYDLELAEFLNNYRSRAILKELSFDARHLIKRSLEEYRNLSRVEQIEDIKFFIEDFARQLDLDPDAIFKIVEIESNYNYLAQSNAKAYGLMQVKEVQLEELKKYVDFRNILGFIPEVKDLFNPYVNLVVGMYSFRYFVEKYTWNYETALMVYNIGVGNYAKLLAGDQKQKGAASRYVGKFNKLKLKDGKKK